jgi:hypothetical protein
MHVNSVCLDRENGLAAETMIIFRLGKRRVGGRLPFEPTGFSKRQVLEERRAMNTNWA